MENNNDSSSNKGLVNELVEGRDLTKKLQWVISNGSHSSSNEAYGLMAKNILARFERSLQILQYDSINPNYQILHQRSTTPTTTVDSPNSLTGSPKSQDSEADFKDSVDHHHHNKDDSKKRKVSHRVTHRVQGCTSSGLEGPVEDGYNWRKYGQKDILGANFPRAYYRCTHRCLQGCLATKQVQRSDDDPGFFDVTYRGTHTCFQSSSSSSSIPLPKLEPVEIQPSIMNNNNIIWDFKKVDSNNNNNNNNNNNGEDIKKPKNINHTNPNSSFSFSCSPNLLVDTHQLNPTTIMPNNNNDNNFVRRNDFYTTTNNVAYSCQLPSSVIISTNFINDLREGTNSMCTVPSELQYDYQGEFGNDYFNDNNSQIF